MLRRIRRGLTESKNQSMEEDVVVVATTSPKQYERRSAPPNLFIMSRMRRSLCDVDAEYLCSSVVFEREAREYHFHLRTHPKNIEEVLTSHVQVSRSNG